MKDYQLSLLVHLSQSLFGNDETIQYSSEEEYVEAKLQSVLPFVVPQDDLLCFQLVVHNIQIEAEHMWLHELLTNNGIPYVILKGVASAQYYREPNLRVLGDVDFLIRREDIPAVEKIMSSIGCMKRESNSDHHIAFHNANGTVFELHWMVPGMPENNLTISHYLENIIDSAVLKNGYMVPSDFCHGIVLLLHTAWHMMNTGIGLRHLCDWAAFYSSFSNDDFRRLFEKPLKEMGLFQFARILTLTAVKYLKSPTCDWAGEIDCFLLEDIMDDIISGGNFGIKSPDRINEAKLITDKQTRTVNEKNMFIQLYKSISYKAQTEYDYVRKHKWLLPLGCVHVVIKHGIMIKNGQRSKVKMKQTMKKAKHRRDIYKELKLFQ